MKNWEAFKAAAVGLGLATAAGPAGAQQMAAPDPCSPLKERKVLVLPGNGHDGPRNATLANLRAFAAQVPFSIRTDNLPSPLTDAFLADFDIIVFNYFFNTANNAYFPQASREAFMRWLKRGKKGYVGYHTSGANEWAANEWRNYQDSVTGMRYALHGSGTPTGTVEKSKDPAILAMPIMRGLPDRFTGADEWYEYNLDSKIFDPAWNWKIMYYLTSVSAPRQPGPPNHPAAWFREDAAKTRFFYSIFIHTQDGANSPFFKSVLLRAMEYVAGEPEAPYPGCTTPISVPEGAGKARPGLAYITTRREVRVELDSEYRFSVWSPSGRELYSAHGSGRSAFAPPAFRNHGLYFVKIEGPGSSYTEKILVY